MHRKSRRLLALLAPVVLACSVLGCGTPDQDFEELAQRKLAVFSDSSTRPATFPSPVGAHSGLSAANKFSNPTYPETTITNETIGVSGTNTKSKVFLVHPITAASGFTIRLTTTQQNKAAVTLVAPDGRATTCFHNGTDCVAPPGAEQVTLRVKGRGTGTWYATYSTTYWQNCDNSAGRVCTYITQFHDQSVRFDGTTENYNGSWQGYVKLFCLPMSGSDAVTLRFTSDTAVANVPTLRIAGTTSSGSEATLNQNFDCTYKGLVNGGPERQYECVILSGTFPSIPSDWINPYLKLSSARTSSAATIRMWNATRTTTNDISCQ